MLRLLKTDRVLEEDQQIIITIQNYIQTLNQRMNHHQADPYPPHANQISGFEHRSDLPPRVQSTVNLTTPVIEQSNRQFAKPQFGTTRQFNPRLQEASVLNSAFLSSIKKSGLHSGNATGRQIGFNDNDPQEQLLQQFEQMSFQQSDGADVQESFERRCTTPERVRESHQSQQFKGQDQNDLRAGLNISMHGPQWGLKGSNRPQSHLASTHVPNGISGLDRADGFRLQEFPGQIQAATKSQFKQNVLASEMTSRDSEQESIGNSLAQRAQVKENIVSWNIGEESMKETEKIKLIQMLSALKSYFRSKLLLYERHFEQTNQRRIQFESDVTPVAQEYYFFKQLKNELAKLKKK